MNNEHLDVQVVFALPQRQEVVELELPSGTTVAQAVESSGLLQKYPEISLARNKLGIFGKIAKGDTVLRQGDRVEIYRPLIADPKEVRRQRAAEGKPLKKGAE
ncbi:MAG: RnfH family protein [Rhodocyclaceae bacterium]|nr:RnfH family protein [Rhodocyclaceae bacterium]MBX3668613.1 RnfH family protein [Rhodocyclaceae bacterium]